MTSHPAVTLAVTMGDPAGIGPEICLDALLPERLPEGVVPVLIGDRELLRELAGDDLPRFEKLPLKHSADLKRDRMYLLDLGGGAGVEPGQASAASGSASSAYLRAAIDLVDAGVAHGIVTAPISKEAWRLAGVSYPGHTEFLRDAAGVPRTAMLFVGGGMRVALFTTHISFEQAHEALEMKALVGFIGFVVGELGRYGLSGLRVAVAGFNPHAGEGGLFGREDQEIVAPAVEECRRRGIEASGPHPADTLFTPAALDRYDLMIALYHDQGLIPVKALAFREAVNVTLGLPYVRTSPPHGVAYDIARSGRADPSGLVAAIDVAASMLGSRTK